MSDQQQKFIEQGYIVLEKGLDATDMGLLEQSNAQLYQQAQALLEDAVAGQYTLSNYYKEAADDLIVVPEIDNSECPRTFSAEIATVYKRPNGCGFCVV